MQKISLLGIELKDRSKRESLLLVDKFIKQGAVNTIIYMEQQFLASAGDRPCLVKQIENTDITLWDDSEFAQIGGVSNKMRHREVENREFLGEFLKKLSKQECTVLLLAKTSDKAEKLKSDILELEPELMIVGIESMENMENCSIEQQINQMNQLAPIVVIARMSLQEQYKWLNEASYMMNAKIWFGMPESMLLVQKRQRLFRKVKNKVVTKLFRRKVEKYKETNASE